MKRIIIADDEPAVRGLLRQLLERNGYSVVEVTDGADVLRHPELESADLLITDIVMPKVEGIELITRLRREKPSLPIIALSGSVNAKPGKYLEIASKIGARKTLPKPFAPKELLEAVRELIGE